MKFHSYGDSAVLINFEQKIDPQVNAKVITLKNVLGKGAIKGLVNCIPAYCSITATYNPLEISYNEICDQIEALAVRSSQTKALKIRYLNIPVCYDAEFSLDWNEVEKQTGLTSKKVIEIHTSAIFQVYMLGFLPGFVYMGSLPESISCSRKTKPRLRVPSRSVGLAGLQTGIYPSEAPGGWQIIGRTPLNIFDGTKTDPFLFRAGDSVKFKAVTKEIYDRIEKNVRSGKLNFEEIYE